MASPLQLRNIANAKSEVHKSHMAAVGTVAIPHEAGAFALASLAVPGMQTPVMYLSTTSNPLSYQVK